MSAEDASGTESSRAGKPAREDGAVHDVELHSAAELLDTDAGSAPPRGSPMQLGASRPNDIPEPLPSTPIRPMPIIDVGTIPSLPPSKPAVDTGAAEGGTAPRATEPEDSWTPYQPTVADVAAAASSAGLAALPPVSMASANVGAAISPLSGPARPPRPRASSQLDLGEVRSALTSSTPVGAIAVQAAPISSTRTSYSYVDRNEVRTPTNSQMELAAVRVPDGYIDGTPLPPEAPASQPAVPPSQPAVPPSQPAEPPKARALPGDFELALEPLDPGPPRNASIPPPRKDDSSPSLEAARAREASSPSMEAFHAKAASEPSVPVARVSDTYEAIEVEIAEALDSTPPKPPKSPPSKSVPSFGPDGTPARPPPPPPVATSFGASELGATALIEEDEVEEVEPPPRSVSLPPPVPVRSPSMVAIDVHEGAPPARGSEPSEAATRRADPSPAAHGGLSMQQSQANPGLSAQPSFATPPPPSVSSLAGSPGGLPPMSAPPTSLGEGPRRRMWWEDLFGDDHIRTMNKISDAQIATEATFIEESLALQSGAMILDLGCGTGRHAIDLTRRGYQVVGFDLSLAMLAKAADEAQDRRMKLNFVQGDMRELSFEETFDGIYCWNTSFGYFDEEKNAQVIARVHRALKRGGNFLLDVVNRDFLVAESPSMAWFEGDGCVCMDEMSLDWITSRMKIKRTLMLDDGRTKESEFSVRVYSLHELGKVLHEHGFRVAEVSGLCSTPGVFFGAESPRTMILAEKR